MDQLKVDYVNDSLNEIAIKLHDAGWQFLPSSASDLSEMTPNIPSDDDMEWGGDSDILVLHAVFPVSDDKEHCCEIYVSTRVDPDDNGKQESRGVQFIGCLDYGAPTILDESTGEREIDKTWIADVIKIQKQALVGFLPTKYIELLSTGSWEETGLTKDQIDKLLEASKNQGENDGSYSNSLIWDEVELNGDDFWNFHAIFSHRYSNDYELRYFRIQKDVYDEIIMEADNADNCINSITFDFYK